MTMGIAEDMNAADLSQQFPPAGQEVYLPNV